MEITRMFVFFTHFNTSRRNYFHTYPVWNNCLQFQIKFPLMFPRLTKIPRHSCNILKFPDWNSSGSVIENPVRFLQKKTYGVLSVIPLVMNTVLTNLLRHQWTSTLVPLLFHFRRLSIYVLNISLIRGIAIILLWSNHSPPWTNKKLAIF